MFLFDKPAGVGAELPCEARFDRSQFRLRSGIRSDLKSQFMLRRSGGGEDGGCKSRAFGVLGLSKKFITTSSSCVRDMRFLWYMDLYVASKDGVSATVPQNTIVVPPILEYY